jgi:CheY-like chemotaxis protein
MAKPILLSVDDDADVLRAIERDLRSHYGAEYRVIGSGAPDAALELLKQLKVRNDSVALLLADQRMPRMDGVTFLQEAMRIFPRRQAGVTHRLCRYQRRHQRHQRCQHQLLFPEAVGSSQRAPLSAGGRLTG